MAQLNWQADPNNVAGEYEVIPAGEYLAEITASEMAENSARNGHYLKLELTILDGDQAGRKVFDRLNLQNPNRTAVEIAERTLNAICVAVGKMAVQQSEELHGIPMVIKVKVDPPRTANGKDYGPSNAIGAYKPRGGSVTSFGSTPSPAPAPTPAYAAGQPQGQQMATGNVPPWKRSAA
ncbi:DUF669 domain-containing protein [Blastomonas sp. CCH1-A6]|uniref:DUF669 domain-containing protein n=1 Tax=Blastomonas sp. CCH1-A6 TaxID=1768762 RepID=UPI00082CEA16